MKNTLGKTNAGHTPIAAILCCSTFGLLAFLGLADLTYNQVRIPVSKQHTLKGLVSGTTDFLRSQFSLSRHST